MEVWGYGITLVLLVGSLLAYRYFVSKLDAERDERARKWAWEEETREIERESRKRSAAMSESHGSKALQAVAALKQEMDESLAKHEGRLTSIDGEKGQLAVIKDSIMQVAASAGLSKITGGKR